MSKELKLRDGYKTLTARHIHGDIVVLAIHRPPHAWLEFMFTETELKKFRTWLEQIDG